MSLAVNKAQDTIKIMALHRGGCSDGGGGASHNVQVFGTCLV